MSCWRNRAGKIFLHKIVLFYLCGNNCVGSALADDRIKRRHRDPRPEQRRVTRAYRHGLVRVLRPGPEEPLLGELGPGVSTLAHSHRETSLSIATLGQTYLSEIAVLSFSYFPRSHGLFPLFYQTIEASHASQRNPWHGPCKRTVAKTGMGLSSRRGYV